MHLPVGTASGGENNKSNLLPNINKIAGITSLFLGTVNNILTQTRLGSNISYYLLNNKAFLNSVNYFKSVGYWASGLSIGTDVLMSYAGQKSWAETGINTSVAAVAFYVGGWPGIGISLIYNGTKLQIEQYQNVPPHMDKHWRRYSPGPY